MDLEARSSCLRAVALVARNARICATVDAGSDQYQTASASIARVIDRAEKYYVEMKQGHAPHERAVRVVLAALVEAKVVARWLAFETPDQDDLSLQAEKIERAIERAGALTTPPVAAP